MSALGIIIFCLAGAMMAALVHAHGLMRQACAKTQRRKDAETRRREEPLRHRAFAPLRFQAHFFLKGPL